jgi:hypothetical protein
MVSTYTPNIQLEEPARGDYVGTWDTPVNSNMTVVDLILGGRTTISGAAGNVVLASAQFQCKTITFNSTLLASITVTLPTSFTKSYEIYNTCTGSSAYTITLQTTAAGGQVICAPPGEIVEVINDGTNLRYKNLGRVGEYWDYGGSSVPNWVSGCTVAPYLNCDGTAFSSATFPQLVNVLGGTTLPDARGRFRATLNQGTARLSSQGGRINGNTNLASGGQETVTIATSNLPAYTPTGTVNTGTVAIYNSVDGVQGAGSASVVAGGTINGSAGSQSALLSQFSGFSFTGTPQGGQSADLATVPPSFMGGLTLIRSA